MERSRLRFTQISKNSIPHGVVYDPPCRIMSYTLRDRCDETNRADEAAMRQVVREISAQARRFPRPSFDALHYGIKCIIIRVMVPIGDVKLSALLCPLASLRSTRSTASCLSSYARFNISSKILTFLSRFKFT